MAAPAYDKIQFDLPTGFAKVQVALATTFQGIPVANGSPFNSPSIPREILTVGTGAGQFNAASKFYTATSSGNTDYDLTTLLDPFGTAINLDNARYVLVYNFATSAAFKLLVDGTVTNAWLAPFNGIATAQLVVPPGWTDGTTVHPGVLLLGSGAAAGLITSPTSKVVRLAAGGNSIPHAFQVIGVDA